MWGHGCMHLQRQWPLSATHTWLAAATVLLLLQFCKVLMAGLFASGDCCLMLLSASNQHEPMVLLLCIVIVFLGE
jgi:hypothetical protein